MFSGLTNQVSSWMGAAKGEPQDEDVPTPTKEEAAAAAAAAAASTDPEKQSPTKAGGKLDLITNVKSQMTGWLGQGLPLPGLRKAEVPPAPSEEAQQPPPEPKDDDDNSSATGGADSRPGSGGNTPPDDQAPMPNVTTKAVAGAKSLGNFLYSAVNKAGAKVSEAGAKIKKTVEENSILGELSREQEAFLKSQPAAAAATAPWVGAHNEAALKDECLALSQDRRNFVRAPPAGVEFSFDYDQMYPVALAVMQEDPNLEKMRFDLVPKVITEQNFWRNYFYRLSLICQANEADAGSAAAADADTDYNNDQWERELESELSEFELVASEGVTANNQQAAIDLK